MLSSSYEFQKFELDLNLFELIKFKQKENWQSVLCTRAETGGPSHLGWWPTYKEKYGRERGLTHGRWATVLAGFLQAGGTGWQGI
jgi:hypothetical protein